MKAKDISVEEWREYDFISNEGIKYTYRITKPINLYVADSGSHRVVDSLGVTHYIRKEWFNLRWYSPTEHVSF